MLEGMIAGDTEAVNINDGGNARTLFRFWVEGLINSKLPAAADIYAKCMVDYSDENNMYRLDKGIQLYRGFLDRILHNKNIKSLGYTKNVLFIPVMDWIDDIKTKSYIYTKDINPISMIYRLMLTDLPSLKKLFDMPVVFMGNGTYFKVDFSKFESNHINLFIQKLKQLYKLNAVDDDELSSKDSKAAIVDDIIDDIEDSQNIKMSSLTGKEKEAPKTAEEVKEKEKEDTKKALENYFKSVLDFQETFTYTGERSDAIAFGITKLDETAKKFNKDQIIALLGEKDWVIYSMFITGQKTEAAIGGITWSQVKEGDEESGETVSYAY